MCEGQAGWAGEGVSEDGLGSDFGEGCDAAVCDAIPGLVASTITVWMMYYRLQLE